MYSVREGGEDPRNLFLSPFSANFIGDLVPDFDMWSKGFGLPRWH